jgi:hypothetical protein
MRKDQCLFCGSRSCYERVVRIEEPFYDEIACPKHVDDLHKHVGEKLGNEIGVGRHYITSTGGLKRGEAFG